MKITYGAIVQRASGKFGGTVHSNWKGVDVVRRFAKPSNPNSVGQQATRNAFRALTLVYLLMPASTKAAWTSWVTGKPLIARNKLLGDNVPLIAGNANMAAFLPTPGDSSTLPPVAAVPTGGAGQISVSITAPTTPAGWTLTAAWACCIVNSFDPSAPSNTATEATMHEASDASAPYAAVITGLSAGTYYTWAFLQWLAPDGSTRYSPVAVGGTAVVS